MSSELPITEEDYDKTAKSIGLFHFSMGCEVEPKYFKVCVTKESENDWPKIREIYNVFELDPSDKVFYRVRDYPNRLLRKEDCEICSCDNCYRNKDTMNCSDCADYSDWQPMPSFKVGDKIHFKFDKVFEDNKGKFSINKNKVGKITWINKFPDGDNYYRIKVKFDFCGLTWEIVVNEPDVVLA
jgi:hypothetical protein